MSGICSKNSTASSTVILSTSAMLLSFMLNLHRLAVVALALADLAGHIDIGQKMHLDLDQAIALAGFTAAALHIETIAAGLVAANARFGQIGIEIPDEAEQTRIGRRIRARRPADRATDRCRSLCPAHRRRCSSLQPSIFGFCDTAAARANGTALPEPACSCPTRTRRSHRSADPAESRAVIPFRLCLCAPTMDRQPLGLALPVRHG